MKKILIILMIFFSFNTLAYNLNEYKWYSFNELYKNRDKLKPFDIVVLSPGEKLTQKWGHVFIVSEDLKLLEIKNEPDEVFAESPIYSYSNLKNRQVSVLRYKDMNENLSKEMSKLIKDYYNKDYSFLSELDKSETYETYCSKFIYTLFKDAGEKLGENIAITDKYFILFPFYFFDSKEFIKVEL